jgi:PIN domain nuclease of toxin-antitoxin system
VSVRGDWIRRPGDVTTTSSLLLDTHIWVWYLDGDATRLSADAVALLDRVANRGALRVADICYWEVAAKSAKGTLEFAIDAAVWLNRAANAPGIRFLALDRDVLLLSTRLPGTLNNDHVDRMLIATSQLYDLPLVTADRAIIDYARACPGTTVIDARPPSDFLNTPMPADLTGDLVRGVIDERSEGW